MFGRAVAGHSMSKNTGCRDIKSGVTQDAAFWFLHFAPRGIARRK